MIKLTAKIKCCPLILGHPNTASERQKAQLPPFLSNCVIHQQGKAYGQFGSPLFSLICIHSSNCLQEYAWLPFLYSTLHRFKRGDVFRLIHSPHHGSCSTLGQKAEKNVPFLPFSTRCCFSPAHCTIFESSTALRNTPLNYCLHPNRVLERIVLECNNN